MLGTLYITLYLTKKYNFELKIKYVILVNINIITWEEKDENLIFTFKRCTFRG